MHGNPYPSFAGCAIWDILTATYRALAAQSGNWDPDKALAFFKGYKAESPRGPIVIDPETRDIIQNIYLRRVEKHNGVLVNTEFATYPMVEEPRRSNVRAFGRVVWYDETRFRPSGRSVALPAAGPALADPSAVDPAAKIAKQSDRAKRAQRARQRAAANDERQHGARQSDVFPALRYASARRRRTCIATCTCIRER